VAVRRRPSGEASGQHFLRSKRLAANLVAEAGTARGDLVVEIGGGTGMLTKALVLAGARVVVVERDPVLAAQLGQRFPGVEVVEADAAALDWPSEPFSVVANLPFARSGAILAHLLRDPRAPLRRAHVIVQWEFAAKHAAVWPATLRSTYWRAWYDVTIAHRLDRSAFAPPPSVESAVLCFERRAPRIAPERHQEYWRFLSAAFASQQAVRRLASSPLAVKRLAPALGFSPDARARDLDAGQWAQLFALFSGCSQVAPR
jgi:23S rRNA (adenine-N6)-dimethyltransferase